MTLGEVLLSSLSSGVITQDEVDWVTSHQHCFSREEVASALRLGRLIDTGDVNLGCRLPLSVRWVRLVVCGENVAGFGSVAV